MINNKKNNRTSVSYGRAASSLLSGVPGGKGRGGVGQETENRKNMYIFEEMANFFQV